jgi:hypothetical protein
LVLVDPWRRKNQAMWRWSMVEDGIITVPIKTWPGVVGTSGLTRMLTGVRP